MVLNYFIIISAFAVSGLCIYEGYKEGLQIFLLNLIVFVFALISRMFLPGLIINYALFRIYGIFTKFYFFKIIFYSCFAYF